ncbi:MAG: hypothetical protein NTX82_06885 [Candidatus Parcubacteria bacterium]|nr:hypothetical protein [Candidatus Parcubacteria bacterium]
MKKFFKFLSIGGIIVMIFSLSLINIPNAQAGSITFIQSSLSNYEVSAAVNGTFVFDPATEVNDGDGIQINFETDYDITGVLNADVAVTQTGGNPTKGTAVKSGQNLQIPITTGGTVPDNAITVTLSNSHLVNPTIPGDYIITVTTWDLGDDGLFGGAGADADTLEDTGVAAVFINAVGGNQVVIYGTVDPVLSLTLSSHTCDLGVLSASAFKSCGYDVTVGTNAIGGYTGAIQSDGGLRYGAYSIMREADGDDNDQIDGGVITNSEYGIGIVTQDTGSVYPALGVNWANCAAINNDALSFDVPIGSLDNAAAQTFASSATAVDGGVTTGNTSICHVARIIGTQAPGAYTQLVTITVVGNF